MKKLRKFAVVLGLACSLTIQSNMPFVHVAAAQSMEIVATRDDELVIPDKYNTGCRGELIDFSTLHDDKDELQQHTDLTGGLKLVFSGGYKVNLEDPVNKGGTYIIENADFSDAVFAFNKAAPEEINLIFNNCKFDEISTLGGNINVTLNNCSIRIINSQNTTLNNCQLGHSYDDPIRPFSNSYFNNCFICDLQYYYRHPTEEKASKHIDGTQIFGYGTKDAPIGGPTRNINFKNCRFEIPTYYLGEGNQASMNDCIFLQNEYNEVYDVSLEDIITNGANYQFSAHRYTPRGAQPGTYKYEAGNISLKNCRMGQGSISGIMIAVEPYVEVTNTMVSTTLYVGSTWKDSKGTHFSVTNDSTMDRSLTIVSDKGVYSFTIPAFPKAKDTNVPGNTLTYKDYPIDIDICVPANSYAVCYDTTVEPIQVRFVNYSGNQVVLDESVLKGTYPGIKTIKEGECGPNVKYKLTNDGTLTISGTGPMNNYSSDRTPPWMDDYVRKLVIEEGVTSIATQMHNQNYSLCEVELPTTLKSIGGRSFVNCDSLESIYIPASVESIGGSAFDMCDRLKIKYAGSDWSKVSGGEDFAWQVEYVEPIIPEKPKLPGTIKLVSATANVSSITVKWNADAEAESYIVYRKIEGESWKKLGEVDTTSYKDTTAKDGIKYCYTVRGLNQNGRSASYDKTGVSATISALPGTIKLISATANTSSITVKWNADAKAESYVVYRKIEGENWKNLGEVKTTSYNDTSAKSGVKYYYTVRGLNKNGRSESYDKIGVSAIITGLPGTVKLVSATANTSSITVKWNADAAATSYVVYRKTDGESWKNLGEVKTTSYNDTSAKGGIKYYYTVRGLNQNGRSASYDKTGVSATITALPGTVKLISATAGSGYINVKWEPVSTAESYIVYRKIDGGSWKSVGEVKTTSFKDETVKKGTTYIYTVKAMNINGKSASYDKVGVTATAK